MASTRRRCQHNNMMEDSDTISTWRTVHDADKDQRRTISVLTKADLALKDGKESLKSRIEKIDGESKSSECFIVHGAAKDCADEENQLAKVKDYVEELRMADRILIGADALNKHLEEHMLDHIKEKIPEMRRLLETELRSCKNELAKTGREAKPPLAIALRDIDAINEAVQNAYNQLRPKLRKLTEEMSRNVMAINMELLGLVDFEESKRVLEDAKSRSSQDFCSESYIRHALAMEVKHLEEDSREHINVSFVGKGGELSRWLHQFSGPCTKITEKYVDDVFDSFCRDVLQPSLDKGCSEPTALVGKRVEATLMQLAADKRDEALSRVREIDESVKQNMLTTNSHYLVETADGMKKGHAELFQRINSSYSMDMKPHFHTVYSILGFIKTRKKFVPEAVQLDTLRILNMLLEETKESVKAGMVEEGSLELIAEPASLARRRTFNLEREKQIEKVFNEIRFL